MNQFLDFSGHELIWFEILFRELIKNLKDLNNFFKVWEMGDINTRIWYQWSLFCAEVFFRFFAFVFFFCGTHEEGN